VVAGGMICFCIVVILQAVTVAYILSNDDSSSDNNDRSVPTSPSALVPPTTSPTQSPAFSRSQFRSIANLPGSVLLQTASGCDYCIENVPTPSIPWSKQRQKLSSVQVSSDGRLLVICDYNGMSTTCGSIHVIDMDLAPHVSGEIYYYWFQTENQGTAFEGDSLVVSWENVLPYGYWDPNEPFQVNAQVIISNQQVEICYGEGNTGGGTFQAGYYNYTTANDGAPFVPFVGPSFDVFYGFSNSFPSNTCQILRQPNQQDGSFPPSPSVNVATLPPTISPTRRPSSRPTFTPRPTPSIPSTYSCVPTYGACVDNYQDLQSQLGGQWGSHHTVAICGDMGLGITVRVLEPNTIVCCASSRCEITNSGILTLPILKIFDENITLVGLSFRRKEGTTVYGNSLVVFEKAGYHTIQDCRFSNGQTSEYGGNLLVTGAAEIRIFNSTFQSGRAEIGGGGAAFRNVRSVHIENSFFLSNLATKGGGGLLFFDYDPSFHGNQSPSVYIVGALFEDNAAVSGGGFEIRDLEYPKLWFSYNGFVSNGVAEFGSAGAIVNASRITARFSSNYGRDNTAGSICPSFLVEDTSWSNSVFGPDCFELVSFVDLFPPATTIPSERPTLSSLNSCVPTNGQCAATEDDLRVFVRLARPGDTVAVCGIIPVKDTIVVEQPNITICCTTETGCSLDSWDGSKRIMAVQGANFTLYGIQMQRGFAQSRGGGNLLISAPGHHTIQDAVLIGGTAGDYGGNLHVANADSVTISGSTLEYGSAVLFGGKSVFHPSGFSLSFDSDQLYLY